MRWFLLVVICFAVLGVIQPVNAQSDGNPPVWLGIIAQDVDESTAQKLDVAPNEGIFVAFTMPFGPADKQGVLIGDVLMTLDGQSVTSTQQVKMQLRTYAPGQTVPVTLLRDSELMDLEFTLPAYDASAAEGMQQNNDDMQVL
jgi:S1-C subfamily serine protease